ncbi:MAG: hypothetical protein IPG42_03260 [Betaproteobacteria bacterium]|nr:hypothetical protein [Betaproteobacteria bacterium]MBK7656273.1 hypothetical protein [Betaproteobacteria bacterium]MBP6646976.1 hypothetical protein [Burkholderiaceae bacterium]
MLFRTYDVPTGTTHLVKRGEGMPFYIGQTVYPLGPGDTLTFRARCCTGLND